MATPYKRIKRPALKDMTADELRERLERLRKLNPYNYERSQAYRNTAAALRRIEGVA